MIVVADRIRSCRTWYDRDLARKMGRDFPRPAGCAVTMRPGDRVMRVGALHYCLSCGDAREAQPM